MRWTEFYEQLWSIINQPGDLYFDGPRFLNAVRRVYPDLSPFDLFIAHRRHNSWSTDRKEYFFDILDLLDISTRIRAV